MGEKVTKKSPLKNVFSDIFFVSLLSLLSLIFISFYFKANYLEAGYQDWIIQAFRIRLLDTYGLSSWTHMWSDGISIWRSYQFIPHYLTLGLVNLFSLEIPRAMVVMTIIQYVLLRVFIYGALRILKFSPVVAFICSILSFDIAQYWGGVGDFSLLFAFTFFPPLIVFWTRYHQGKLQQLYPYICGISFYVHPMLGFSTSGLWAFSLLFSGVKIISKRVFLQLFIILATASLFWFPIVSKLSYYYTNPVFSTQGFLDLAISKYSFFGLSGFILVTLVACSIWMFKPITEKFEWTKVLFFFCFIYLLLIIIGLAVKLPGVFYQFQYSRGITLIGIGIIFSFALVAQNILKVRSILFKGIFLFVMLASLIEGMWFASVYSPQPSQVGDDVVTTAIEKKIITTRAGRIWTPTINWSSFMGSLDARYPYSYMEHMDSNQIPQRLSQLILYHPYFEEAPQAIANRLKSYFEITGTKYLLFEENSPFTKTYEKLVSQGYRDLGKVETKRSLYHAFEAPWEIRNSILVDKKYEMSMDHFPFDLKFSIVNDQIALDDYVEKFAKVLYKPDNISLPVEYTTPTTLSIGVPSDRQSNLVYVNESHDKGWKAYFNGVEQEIRQSGPNYMLVRLENLTDSGTLTLVHTWPLYFYIGLYFVFLIPFEILILNGILFMRKKKEVTQ